MFALPRSSWQDYDKSKLSEGGVIISRSQKSVTLPAAAAAAIGLAKTIATPAEIMTAILKAPVDLLWFGGIGTYVRATGETNAGSRRPRQRRHPHHRRRSARQGDRRGRQSRRHPARPHRVRPASAARCNSDAIDNSGGVNCSDVEVNIKIALAVRHAQGSADPAGAQQAAGRDDRRGRRRWCCPTTTSRRWRSRSRASAAWPTSPHQARFMAALEARGLLDRAVETLPSPAALAEREARGEPLTRAELGVLLAYAKIVLFSDIVASDVPDDRAFRARPDRLFPRPDGEEIRRRDRRPPAAPRDHRARARQRPRSTAAGRPSSAGCRKPPGAARADVVRAFAVVRDGFGLPALYREIDALDNKIDGQVQLDLYAVGRPADRRRPAAWDLKNEHGDGAARRAHRRAAGGAQGAGAEARLAAAGLHAASGWRSAGTACSRPARRKSSPSSWHWPICRS